jgi:hypothetical protein
MHRPCAAAHAVFERADLRHHLGAADDQLLKRDIDLVDLAAQIVEGGLLLGPALGSSSWKGV